MDEHLCPQKDCGEVLSRNKKGDFPQFCPECNGPTGLGKDSQIYCPDPECGELLKKNKKGVYPKHCPECNGLTETVERPKALLCPNVQCGVPLSENKEGLYPRFCSECGCAIERRTGLQAPISSELVMGCRRDNEGNSTHRTSDRQKYDSQTAHSESTEGNIDKQLSNPSKPDQEEASMPQKTGDPQSSSLSVAPSDLTQTEVICCPKEGCGAKRKRSKSGVWANFCRACRFEFQEGGEFYSTRQFNCHR